MENSKEVTIYDIAQRLDLSPSTVSKALNDDPTISKKTRKRITETAAGMGYRSNFFAKNLRQQSTLTIGVIVHELNSGFTTPVLSGIEGAASEGGYGMIVADSAGSREKEVDNARSFFQRRVDGVIAVPGAGSLEHFRPFTDRGVPLVFLDRADSFAGSTSVVADNVACGMMATLHLIEQGCRRIVHLTPGAGDNVYGQRYEGYWKALARKKIAAEKSLLIIAEPTEEASEAAARKILALTPVPDAVFAANDMAAAVCIRVFQERGLRVPQDIAVVGFGNEIIGKLMRPTLTTINYPAKEMGDTAARILINHLQGNGEIDKVTTTSMRAELVVRQSSLRKG
ncbi:MAG: LacI family DNA-binding transcriptional regulator [Bacteroidetes bacterium]|nr:LacI family DNA-binding transcriptional regulator [Bacteroidota bacterium]